LRHFLMTIKVLYFWSRSCHWIVFTVKVFGKTLWACIASSALTCRAGKKTDQVRNDPNYSVRIWSSPPHKNIQKKQWCHVSHGEWSGTENSAVTPTKDQTPTGMCMTGVVVYTLELLKDVNIVMVFKVFRFSWQWISELILTELWLCILG
jgi:hypothetical protein